MPTTPSTQPSGDDAHDLSATQIRTGATPSSSRRIRLERIALVDMTDEEYDAAVEALYNVLASHWFADKPQRGQP